jgi:RNA polymerase sigma factor (sigma-70 family)
MTNTSRGPEVSTRPGTIQDVGLPERDPALARAVRALPARRRLLVFLRYYADLSYAEIAAAAGVSEGTVAATLAQARESLLAALEKEPRS